MDRVAQFASSLLAVATLAACSGCGEDWQAATYPATGRLTINGKPAAGALVQLIASGPGPDVRDSRPWGLVAADGTFQLATYETGTGAPAGDYRLTITWPVDAARPGSPDRLKGKYADPAAAHFPVTIRAGATEIPSIELNRVIVAQNPRPTAAGRRPMP